MHEGNGNRNENRSGTAQAPFWERAVALVGLALALASLGYLIYAGVWGDHSPPDIVVREIEIHDSGEDFLVRFEARNIGGETGAGVRITGRLSRDGTQIEQTEATLDYVPQGSSVRGGLYFKHDPALGTLSLDASGYQRP